MPSNVSVTIEADTTKFNAQVAIAAATSRGLAATLNSLGLQAAQTAGPISNELKSALLVASEASLKAKAQLAALKAQLAEAQGSTSSFGELLETVKSGLGSLGVAVSAAAVLDFAKSIEESTAHLEHESEVLQISSTAYQDFRNAAIDSGVDVDTLDGALRKFTTSLGQAQAGSAAQAKAFVELGVSANQPAQDALPQVAAALLRIKDSGERARLETELFGRSGAELNPLLGLIAIGVDALTAKYTAMGRMLDPQVTKAAKEADEKLEGSWEHLKTATAGPIAAATDALASFVDILARVRLETEGLKGSEILPGVLRLAPKVTPPPPAPMVQPQAPSEQEEIAALGTIDEKLKERSDLTKELTMAQKALADAEHVGDTKGEAAANQAIADIKKQQDALNKTSAPKQDNSQWQAQLDQQLTQLQLFGAKADAYELKFWQDKLAIAQAGGKQYENEAREASERVFQLETKAAQQAATEQQEIARSNASRDLALARTTLEEKKTILAEELAAHQITAQQKYDQTVQALNDEAAAEKKALEDEIADANTSLVRKTEDQNQITIITDQTNAQIAAAARQLTSDLRAEDQKRFESWSSVDKAIEQTESELVQDILTKRQSLSMDLLQISGKMLEQEIADDLKAATEHEMVNLGMMASDKATAQEGLLYKLASYLAAELGFGESQTANAAAAAAGATALQTATATANLTAAESNAAVAATGAAASQAAIPIVGPELAVAAAAATFGSLQGFVGMAGFEQGIDVVPQDMIAQIHAGERIMPAADNSALMSALGQMGGGGQGASGGQNGGTTIVVQPQVNALDGQSAVKALKDPTLLRSIAVSLGRYMQNNPSARGNY